MGFVILQPGSNSNPTEKYRVVNSEDLMRYINGATKSYGYTQFDDYQAALVARDVANTDLARGE